MTPHFHREKKKRSGYSTTGNFPFQVLVYVSTAYTNCEYQNVKEKVYHSKMDWRKMIKAAETMDETQLNAIAEKLLDDSPNTYIFSKNLAEHIVYDHRHEFPVVIFRPSVSM